MVFLGAESSGGIADLKEQWEVTENHDLIIDRFNSDFQMQQ